MEHLQTLAGGTAVLIVCALLFIEESGIPMPFTPGDIVLVSAGYLAAIHSTYLWVIMPLAYASCIAGALTCFLWSGRVGRPAVLAVGRRIGITERRLLSAEGRLRHAGPRAVFAARIIPGMRVYGSVASGCLRLELRSFLTGLLPAVAMWLSACTLLGYYMGTRVDMILRVWDRAMVAVTVAVVLTAAARWLLTRRRTRVAPDQVTVAIAA
jgi:membrane-associated protein